MRTRKRTCFALWHGVERQLTQTEQSESTDPTQTERTRPTSRTSSSDRESERICDQKPFPGIDHKSTTRPRLPDRSKSHSSLPLTKKGWAGWDKKILHGSKRSPRPKMATAITFERSTNNACRSHAGMWSSYSRPTSPIIGEPHS